MDYNTDEEKLIILNKLDFSNYFYIDDDVSKKKHDHKFYIKKIYSARETARSPPYPLAYNKPVS